MVVGARSFGSACTLSDKAVVWQGRGATARPREAKWSSGVAGVDWVYCNKIFSKMHLDVTIITFTTEEHYIIPGVDL